MAKMSNKQQLTGLIVITNERSGNTYTIKQDIDGKFLVYYNNDIVPAPVKYINIEFAIKDCTSYLNRHADKA